MAEIRYDHREGPGKGREYPAAANQYFARRGGKLVYLSAAGKVTLCASNANEVMGWAVTPKDATGKSAYKTGSSDKLFVIYGIDDVYEMPANEAAASVNASCIGMSARPYTTGATYAMVQYAQLDPVSATSTAASPLSVVDYDATNKTVFVKIKPARKQAV